MTTKTQNITENEREKKEKKEHFCLVGEIVEFSFSSVLLDSDRTQVKIIILDTEFHGNDNLFT